MKRTLLFSIAMLIGCSMLQNATEEEKHHEMIIENLQQSKQQLFQLAQRWVARNTHSTELSTHFESLESGDLVANVLLPPTEKVDDEWNGRIKLRASFQIRDHRMKVVFDDAVAVGEINNPLPQWNDLRFFHRGVQHRLHQFVDEVRNWKDGTESF
jgi:hypothetical protein